MNVRTEHYLRVLRGKNKLRIKDREFASGDNFARTRKKNGRKKI